MNNVCRQWTVAALGAVAACAVVFGTTACKAGTDAAGPAGPSIAGSASAAEPSSTVSGSPPAAQPSSPGTSFAPGSDCRAADLAYRSHAGDAAAGNYYDDVLVVNHGTVACRLDGYPNLYYTDASGAIRLVPTVPEMPSSSPYVVASGGSAEFRIHTGNGYAGYGPSAPQCAHPMLYRGLSVEVSDGRVPLGDVQIDLKCGGILLLGWMAPQQT
jgi:hypothetical protein